MKMKQGFTLLELVIFMILMGFMSAAILVAVNNSLVNSSTVLQDNIASQTAWQCIQWYIGQKTTNGWSAVSGANCPATLTLPGFCAAPSGYTISGTCSQTTIVDPFNGYADSYYNSITINVTGPGSASLTALFGQL